MKAGLLLAPLALSVATPLPAQAPDLADLWRVASTTLGSPAALQEGPVGVLWNPGATLGDARLTVGVDVLEAADALSMSAILAGVTVRIRRGVAVGVLGGRISIDELTRTSTSPTSEEGEILVYEQFLGGGVAAAVGPARLGATLRLHDSRFDARSAGGATIDLGAAVSPIPRLVLSAASRFASPGFSEHHATDYYVASEYQVRTATLWGANALVLGRYGFAARPGGDGLEHTLSGGVALEGRLWVDLSWTREQGFGTTSWRPVVSVAFRAGRYHISASRGSGLNDVGATFRIGLRADLVP